MKINAYLLRFSFFYFFVLYSANLLAQQSRIDSLKEQIRLATDDSRRLELLRDLGLEFFKNGDPGGKEMDTYVEAFKLARKIRDEKIQIQILYFISQYFLRAGQFRPAEHYASIALQISRDHHLKYREMLMHLALGRIYNRFDDYDKALEHYHQAVALYHAAGKKADTNFLKTLGTVYANMSVTYRNLHNDSLADRYIVLSSDIAERIGDYMRKSNMYSTLGWTYENLYNYEMAAKYFRLALKDSAKIKLKIYNIAAHHGLGYVYGKWGKYDLALHHDSIALNYFKRTGNHLYVQAVMANMADVFLAQNRIPLALEYARKAWQIAKNLHVRHAVINNQILLAKIYLHNNQLDKSENLLLPLLNDTLYAHHLLMKHKPEIYLHLSEIEARRHHWKKAFQYSRMYEKFKDTMMQNKLRRVSAVETKYRAEKKAKENLILKAEKDRQAVALEKENKIKWIFAVSLAFALSVMGIIIYFYYRDKNQKRNIETLHRDLRHRIKNNLMYIQFFIEDLKNTTTDQALRQRLSRLQGRVTSISEVYRQLYSGNQILKIDFKKYVEKLAGELKNIFDVSHVEQEIVIPGRVILPMSKALLLGLIINEFITNAYKYAFDQSEEGKIRIELAETQDEYVLKMSDNGKGISGEDLRQASGASGLELIKLIARQLKGTFKMENRGGVFMEIRFPK